MYKVNNNYGTLTPESILLSLANDEFFKNKNLKITENALVFCTMLYLHYYYFKDKNGNNEHDEKNQFQRIGTDLIIKILTRDYYKDILQRLVELDIIEVNNSYLSSKFSKGYRLHDRFLKEKPVARQIRYDSVKKKFESLNKYFESRYSDEYCFIKQQSENLKLIHIDLERAIGWIEKNKDKFDENGDEVIKNIPHYYRQIFKVSSGFTRKILVSPTNKRVHSLLTSFPRNLRQFLCLIDEETGELNFRKCIIDGKNTQPLLICTKMKQEGIEPDRHFLDFCLTGTLYDYMAKELNESRKWVKD
ncbi:MAG: hypothetical protein ABSG15_05635 [FCB group bacterium]|jgi:hypothetical protein